MSAPGDEIAGDECAMMRCPVTISSAYADTYLQKISKKSCAEKLSRFRVLAEEADSHVSPSLPRTHTSIASKMQAHAKRYSSNMKMKKISYHSTFLSSVASKHFKVSLLVCYISLPNSTSDSSESSLFRSSSKTKNPFARSLTGCLPLQQQIHPYLLLMLQTDVFQPSQSNPHFHFPSLFIVSESTNRFSNA